MSESERGVRERKNEGACKGNNPKKERVAKKRQRKEGERARERGKETERQTHRKGERERVCVCVCGRKIK